MDRRKQGTILYVHMISTRYYDGCYDDADKYMIDRSDLLLVYGEADENLYGVKYAETQGIKFLCLIGG